VLPLSDPPQPLTLPMLLPDPGEIVKLVVLPWATLREVGLIVPLPVPVVEVLTVKDVGWVPPPDPPSPEPPPPQAETNTKAAASPNTRPRVVMMIPWHSTSLEHLIWDRYPITGANGSLGTT
jgi:hypothetical protein